MIRFVCFVFSLCSFLLGGGGEGCFTEVCSGRDNVMEMSAEQYHADCSNSMGGNDLGSLQSVLVNKDQQMVRRILFQLANDSIFFSRCTHYRQIYRIVEAIFVAIFNIVIIAGPLQYHIRRCLPKSKDYIVPLLNDE